MKQLPSVLITMLLVFTTTWGLSGLAFAQGPAVGTKAPDFTLIDTNGKSRTLSEYKGKIVVLEWTNPNCPFVRRHYGNHLMTELQKAYTSKGVVWLLVNSTNKNHDDYESADALNATYTTWGAFYSALLMDADGKVGKAFDAKTTPHMFLIDKSGTLVYQGAVDDDPRGEKSDRQVYLKDALDALMAGKEIATTSTKSYGCSVKYEQ
jgi:peroxiredoxin